MPRRTATPLLAAAGCALFAVVVWIAAFHTGWGERVDHDVVFAVAMTPYPSPSSLPSWFVRLSDPLPYAVLSTLLLLIILRTRGMRDAFLAGVVLLAANVLTQALKVIVGADRASPLGHVLHDSWPSGHTTAAAALALCAVVASPPERRTRVMVLAALFALGMGMSVVVLAWHYPSDALGAYAIAGLVTAVVVGADRVTAPRDRRAPARARPQAARQGAR